MACPTRGASWGWEAYRGTRTRRRQALLHRPIRVRDFLYLDALPHEVLNSAILPANIWQDKYTDSNSYLGFDCHRMGYCSGVCSKAFLRSSNSPLSVTRLGVLEIFSMQSSPRVCKYTSASLGIPFK